MIKLAIVTTHPIQYYAPVFRNFAERSNIEIKVFYTWPQSQHNKYDPGFGKTIEWDIPLLNGYDHTFVNNTSPKPGSNHYKGIVNPTLKEEIVLWGAKAILVFGWSYQSHFACLRYFKGKIPVFFRGDSNLLDEKPGFKQMTRRIFLRWIYRYVDFVFYVGQNNKQYFKAHGVVEKQLIFAPHAIDNERFNSQAKLFEEEASNWRSSLGINPDNVVFLFSGKLEPKKDPLLLLQAFMALNNANTHLIFIGNGILANELKQLAASHSNIHFVDFQNQTRMPVVYRLGNVFVLPSKGPGETWGLAVNEAMACGRPVIVSNKVGCAVDLVHKNTNGYIFTSGQEKELTDTMQMMVSNASNFHKMGQLSLQIIQHWSIPIMVDCMEKAILNSQ